MPTTLKGSYVSADGHVVEPKDLFSSRMDRKLAEKAPHIESRESGDFYVMEGFGEFAIGLSGEGTAATDKAEGKEIHMAGLRYEDTRPGAWDPVERLKDQDLDGIRAEVMYPGVFGLWCYNASDADLHIEIVRVYNDWIAEFSASTPDRLVGVGILPMRGSTESKIAEVERVAKLGLRSVMLPLEVEGGYVNMEGGDRLWAALQDVGLPLGFHVGSSTKSVSADKYRSLGVGVAVIEQKICAVARSLTDLILSGVPQSFPGLRFVMAEGGIGWIPSVLRLNDHWWEDHRHWMEPKLEEAPSSYFFRQFWATFEDDRAGLLTRELLNVDHLMWGSDYPHPEGVFPFSRQQIAKDFHDIPEHETVKIVGDNAAALYGLN